MKNINNYISEKLKITKDTKIITDEISKFAKSLEIPTIEDAKWIYENYMKGERANKIKNEICENDNIFYFPPFIVLFSLADMLIADGAEITYYNWLGLKKYKEYNIGHCNPYDYCIFEEEDENDKTVLEYVQQWIKNNLDEFKKIYNYLKSINSPNKKLHILDYKFILEEF